MSVVTGAVPQADLVAPRENDTVVLPASVPVATTATLPSVEALRGLAAFAVLWCHVTKPAGYASGAIKASGEYGALGVDAFFVISGFILPYVLHQRRYRVGQYGRFLLKRLLRLEPPYLAAVALSLAVMYAVTQVPGYRGQPFDVTAVDVALHLGYLNQFFSVPVLNPVFWTLAIEMQWYVLLGVIYPLLVSGHRARRVAFVAAAGLLACLVPSGVLLFHYAPLFLIGVLAFQRKVQIIGAAEYAVSLAIVVACGAASVGPLSMLVGLLGALVITRVRRAHPALLWLGALSYSLYLVHVPISGRVMNGALRLGLGPLGMILALVAAVALSLLGAYVLHRYVERPSMRAAARIRY